MFDQADNDSDNRSAVIELSILIPRIAALRFIALLHCVRDIQTSEVRANISGLAVIF